MMWKRLFTAGTLIGLGLTIVVGGLAALTIESTCIDCPTVVPECPPSCPAGQHCVGHSPIQCTACSLATCQPDKPAAFLLPRVHCIACNRMMPICPDCSSESGEQCVQRPGNCTHCPYAECAPQTDDH